jgi:hypothetical protein
VTGSVDHVSALIRSYHNDALPKIAVELGRDKHRRAELLFGVQF